MDTLSIILIVTAALVAAAVTFFICRRKMGVSLEQFVPKEELEQARQDLQERINSLDAQKESVQKQLTEAKEEAKALSERMTLLSSDGKIDPELMAKLTDVEKFKKKVKQLEDELDEALDDLDNANKKLKSKTNDFTNLQENLYKIEKDLKQKQEEFAVLQEDLEEKTNLMQLKDESLTFVQHILSAQEFSDQSTTQLYKKVDILSSFIQGELLDTFKSVGVSDLKSAEHLCIEDVKRWEAVQKKNWIAGKIAIAFVGEFSAGKTSIVNRILSQDDPSVPRLPVSAKATTAIPTYISGGPKIDYKFFSQDNKLKKIDAEQFNKVTKEVLDQVGGVSNLIQYFVMSYKNPNLDNLSILDTPGFNSNDKEDAARTLEVINECDALFWVFDVNAGTVNKTSIDLIKKHLKKPLYVVINKTDTKADSEVNKVEQLIRETFQREGVAVETFIRFSAKAPLNNIMEPIKGVNNTVVGENYLTQVETKITNAIDDIKKQSSSLKSKFDQCVRQANALTNRYVKAINQTRGDCETAVSIPHFEEHWFRKDGYELTQEEMSRLQATLDRIAESHMDKLCEIYDNQMEKTQEGQDAWRNYQDSLANVRQMEGCLKQFQKYVTQLKVS